MKKNWLKYIIAFLSVLIIRLIPFRAPNVEPIMAAVMPVGKVFGGIYSLVFGLMSVAVYDSLTSGIGIWTLITGLCYGAIGFASAYFFKNRSGWKNYAYFAVIATIFYDVVTGLSIGPLFFHQSILVSLVGQIPFTFLHLLGNVSFAIVLSPVIEMWVVRKEKVAIVRSFATR